MWKWEAVNPKAVIVMVHGAAEHHGRYKWLIEKWKKEGYHVIMGDLPGQGNISKNERGHIDRFDVYIEAVESWYKEALTYNLPVVLLGHSMGALTVLRTMQEKQLDVSSLVLSSPCLGIAQTTSPSPFLDAASKVLNVITPTLRMDTGLTQEMATRNEEVLEFDRNDPLYVKKVSIRWFRELIHSIELAFQNINKLPDVPMLFMQGGSDQIVNKHKGKEFFAQLKLSDVTYKEWQELYHEIFNEPERDEVFQYTKQFVESHLPTNVQ
ncbi:alpha/beta hydrolase [Bacillus suaedaesalsae]|uniref:Alpha/beta hydrolase n=1 Tax=Bacillus suaedaesalsae TaxID=2810349 RepID=A0ABS2DD50_9BACI|nr:alpha/beta hydrolase [Bacillus suaedaesalsae]MBM6616368.1 alpha/beta hydrolase [Bacillus suaedaesalsae]